MVEIRSYQTTDYLGVKRILRMVELFSDVSDSQKGLEREIQRDVDSILVAVEDEQVVGAQFIVWGFMPFLFKLAVHPEYKRKGIGRELMLKAEELLRKRGYNHANILVLSTDEDLQKTNEIRGYRKSCEYRWMIKEL